MIEAVAQYRLAKRWGITADDGLPSATSGGIYAQYSEDVCQKYRCLFEGDDVDSRYTEHNADGELSQAARLARLDLVYSLLVKERGEKVQAAELKSCLDDKKGSQGRKLVDRRKKEIREAYRIHLEMIYEDRKRFIEVWPKAEIEDGSPRDRSSIEQEQCLIALSPWVVEALEKVVIPAAAEMMAAEATNAVVGHLDKSVWHDRFGSRQVEYKTAVLRVLGEQVLGEVEHFVENLITQSQGAEIQQVLNRLKVAKSSCEKSSKIKKLFAQWDKDPSSSANTTALEAVM